MRVKIIRWTDPTSSQATLRVQRWCEGQWEPVRDFGLHESEQANEFAMKLSMSLRAPIEVAVYQDGKKVEPRKIPQPMYPIEDVKCGPPELAYREQKSENQS